MNIYSLDGTGRVYMDMTAEEAKKLLGGLQSAIFSEAAQAVARQLMPIIGMAENYGPAPNQNNDR